MIGLLGHDSLIPAVQFIGLSGLIGHQWSIKVDFFVITSHKYLSKLQIQFFLCIIFLFLLFRKYGRIQHLLGTLIGNMFPGCLDDFSSSISYFGDER